MRYLQRLLAASLLIAACGDGTGPGNAIPPELAGTWVADTSCLFQCGVAVRNIATPAESLNITAFSKVRTELTLTRRGSYLLVPGFTTGLVSGSVSEANGVLYARSTLGAADTIDYLLSGNVLRIDFRQVDSLHFDTNADGIPDRVRIRAVLQKE